MRIVKITGNKSTGKTEVLKAIAATHEGTVVDMTTLALALPLLSKKVSALNLNTFVDDVTPEDLPKIQKLSKLYPDNYRIYVAGVGL